VAVGSEGALSWHRPKDQFISLMFSRSQIIASIVSHGAIPYREPFRRWADSKAFVESGFFIPITIE
jgi:hypothetical protein